MKSVKEFPTLKKLHEVIQQHLEEEEEEPPEYEIDTIWVNEEIYVPTNYPQTLKRFKKMKNQITIRIDVSFLSYT